MPRIVIWIAACDGALEQIEEKDYVDKLRQDGMRNYIKYGIACFKKDCKGGYRGITLPNSTEMLPISTYLLNIYF